MPRWPGHEVSDETRRRISEATKAAMARPDVRAKVVGWKHSDESRSRMSESAKLRTPSAIQQRDAASPFWQGDAAGYMAKHNWVRKRLGKASRQMCERCGWHAAEWANISGEHRRDLSDYAAMCIPCHRTMDGYRTRKRRGRVS